MQASKVRNWDEVPLVLGPQDILRLGILPGGKTSIYALFHRKDFPAIRHGKRLLVSREALRTWLERKSYTLPRNEKKRLQKCMRLKL